MGLDLPLKPIVQDNKHADMSPETVKTWAGLLTTATPNFLLTHVQLDSCRQGKKLFVPTTVTERGRREWHNTLVGFFLDRKLPYSLVVPAASKFWGNAGLVDTLASDQGTFFFKFDTQVSLDAVLEGGPWHFAGRPIILRKWEPHLSIEKDNISKIPIWVHFFNIPLEYWTPEGLSYIASMIGKPLRVDKTTAEGRRISYARICIEIDATEEWLTEFELEATAGIKPISIKVEYQWTPTRCSMCKCFGHDCQAIKRSIPSFVKAAKNTQRWVPVNLATPSQHPIANPTTDPLAEGLWTEVRRKQRGKEVVPMVEQVTPREIAGAMKAHGSGRQQSLVPTISKPQTMIHGSTSFDSRHISTSNSFNGLIPYEYDLHDDDQSQDDTEEALDVQANPAIRPAPLGPMSARQAKKEAKMQFSRSRPKGRHRS